MLKRLVPLLLIILALLAYFLPWFAHPTAALSLNGYDLAEWLSLTPTARAETPILLSVLRIRSILVFLILLLWLQLPRQARAYPLLLAFFWLIAGTALLPPLEYFTVSPNDPNYQQQFHLALAVWLGSAVSIGIAAKQPTLRLYLSLLLIFFTLLAILRGVTVAYNILATYQLPNSLGGGVILLTLCLLLTGYRLWNQKETV